MISDSVRCGAKCDVKWQICEAALALAAWNLAGSTSEDCALDIGLKLRLRNDKGFDVFTPMAFM